MQQSPSKILKSFRGITSLDSEKFMNKYNCSLNDFIFSPKLWNEILNLNILDGKNINSELYETHFRLKEEQPTWFKLMDFWDLPELEFERLIKQAKSEIESNGLQHTSDVLHTISMLIYLKKNNLIFFSVEDLLPIAKKHWKSLFSINERMREIKDFSFTEHSGSYGFYAKGILEFDKFIKEVMASYEEKYSEQDIERVKNLLDLMDTDGWLFAQRISLTNSEENYYYDYPILKEIDPIVFAKKLCDTNSGRVKLEVRHKPPN
ncbi:NTPase [Acinetobacter schindleri]|uniref:NTPase n=1 Tax=Acinetobacter schindleri TaxID=108981 RepID=UPI0021CD205A|nr:NTPase [Acinetobacter schindleri]